MKKIISIILALMMTLAVGVNAFALTVIDLQPGKPTVKEPIVLEDFCGFDEVGENILIAQSNEGGKFYLPVEYDGKELKNIEIIASGMTAKLVDFNPETMVYPGYEITFCLYEARQPMDDPETKGLTYAEAKEMAKELGKANKKTYQIVPENYLYVVEFTLNPNYTAAFSEGNFQIKAVDKATGTKLATPKVTVIRDAVFFDYENVKSCAQYDYMLRLGDAGYSDYYSYKDGYTYAYADGATCISKTAFRAVEGKKLSVVLNSDDELYMNVVASQSSINLANYFKVDEKAKTIKFGFYGNPVIAGEYTYEVNVGMDVYELAQFFGLTFSEKDVYTFYVMKEGKMIDSFTVDYAKQQSYDDIVLKISGKAGVLSDYELTMSNAQIAEDKTPSKGGSTAGETNPNTGAEVISVFKVLPFGVYNTIK